MRGPDKVTASWRGERRARLRLGVTDVTTDFMFHMAWATTTFTSPVKHRQASYTASAQNWTRADVSLPLDPDDLGCYLVQSTHTAYCFYCYCFYVDNVPSQAQACEIPTISGPQTVWWFNGLLPSGYATIITLTAWPPGAGSYSWAITAGSDKAQFSLFTANTAKLVGRALSSPPGGDVKVKVTVGGATSSEYPVTVRGPYKLVAGSKLHSALPGFGYASQIWYTIRDNLNANMPSMVAFGEQWTTPVDNRYPGGTNWERPSAHGDTTSNSTFYDYITGPGLNNQPPPNPTPTAPQGGNTEVQRSGQEWRFGSTTPGAGARVQTDTWHRYVDHGDNDGITSPAP